MQTSLRSRSMHFLRLHAGFLQNASSFFGLFLTVPAFYTLLTSRSPEQDVLAHILFLMAAIFIGLSLVWRSLAHRHRAKDRETIGIFWLDVLIIFACVASTFSSSHEWSTEEWVLRLGLCAAVVARMATIFLYQVKLTHIGQITLLALILLSSAGAGFYWLEPSVSHYSEGVWLAFTTLATVGYGDLVPSTPASKVFAVFIVLLGYAVFSIVTANIAALFVSEEEKRLKRDLHHDIVSLREEVRHLRRALEQQTLQNQHAQQKDDAKSEN
jgi:voltage-gated potassium channel